MTLRGDPAWSMAADEGNLLVTAGADAVWMVEDVSPSVLEVVAQFWTSNPPSVADLPSDSRAVVEHLAALGALRPMASFTASAKVGLVVVGDACPAFEEALSARSTGFIDGVAGSDGVTVVLRINAPLRALVAVAEDLRDAAAPHVLCDLAFHHTIALGPHVYPGDTACLACLAGRVGNRWGDPLPPMRPAATGDAELAALLAVRWLDRGSHHLINATVAIDLETFTSTRESLWRVPSCPVCGDWQNDGRLP